MSTRAPVVHAAGLRRGCSFSSPLPRLPPAPRPRGNATGSRFQSISRPAGQTLTLNGLGLRKATIFGIKVYVGALYVAHPTADANAILNSRDPVEIDLAFVFHASAGQLRDAWEEGFARSARRQAGAASGPDHAAREPDDGVSIGPENVIPPHSRRRRPILPRWRRPGDHSRGRLRNGLPRDLARRLASQPGTARRPPRRRVHMS